MDRALQAAAYVAGAVLVVSLISLLAGLAMAARPESFAGLGLADPGRAGLAIALTAGAGIILSGIASRVLGLLLRRTDDGDSSYP